MSGSMHVGDYSAGLRLQIFGIKENVKTIQEAFGGIQLPEKFKKSFNETLSTLTGSIEKYEKSLNSSLNKPNSVKIVQTNFDEVQNNLKNMENIIQKISGVPIKLQFNATEAAEVGKLITKLKEYESIEDKINKREAARKKLVTEHPLFVKSSQARTQLLEIVKEAKDFDDAMNTINGKIVKNADASRSAIKAAMPGIAEGKLGDDLSAQMAQLTKLSELLAKIKGAKPGDNYLTNKGALRKPTTDELSSLGLPNITTINQAGEALDQLLAIQKKFAASSANKDLNTAQFASIREQYDDFAKMKQGLGELKTPFSAIDDLINDSLNTNNIKSIEDFTNKFAALKKEISDKTFLSQEGKDALFGRVAQQLDQARASASGLQDRLNSLYNTAKKGERIDEQFNMIASNLKYTFSLVNGFYMAQRVIRQAYQSVKALDESMNSIAVVTNMTTGELWGQIEAYNKLASSMGATVKGAYDVAKLYYQQGKSMKDVNTLTTETLKLSRISGVEYSKATDFMTAALNGFKLEVKDASHVSDVYSNLAAKAAVDTEEIAYAMTKTASIAKNAGMSIENTAALLTQMMETTREAPENIGTAMKTIIARFAEMKMAIGNTFTDEDGEVIDVNRVERALRSAQVQLRDAVTGEIRPVDEIFLELASKWDGLTKNTQRYIATLAAGSRQQSRFIAMMDNYKRTMELVNIAQNSAGAADEQFAKTLDSLESKLNKLSNAWTTFTTGIANADFIKIVVDSLTGVVNLVNTLSDIPVLGAFMKGGTAVAGFFALNAIMGKLVQNVNLFAKSMANAESGTVSEGFKIFRTAKGNQKLINKQQKLYSQSKQQILSTVMQVGQDETQFLIEKNKKLLDLDANNEAKMTAIKENTRRDFNMDDIDNLMKFNEAKKTIEEDYLQKIADLKKKAEVKLADELGAIGEHDLDAINQARVRNAERLTSDLEQVEIDRANRLAALEDPRNRPKTKLSTKIGRGLGAIGGLFGKTGTAAIAAGVVAVVAVTAAVGVFTAALITLYKTSNKFKLKQVNKEISATKKILESAEGAYKDISEGQKAYNDTNTSLSQLTKGTLEYSQALSSANQQVISLLETYPQLIHQITRSNGRLTISAEGWQELLDAQQNTIDTASGALVFKRVEQNNLKATQNYQDLDIRKPGLRKQELGALLANPIRALALGLSALDETIVSALGVETGHWTFTSDELRALVAQYSGPVPTMRYDELSTILGGDENAAKVLAAAQQEEYLKLQNQMLLANQADTIMSSDKIISPFQRAVADYVGQTYNIDEKQADADKEAKQSTKQEAAQAIANALGGTYVARNGKVFANATATTAVEGYKTDKEIFSAYADILAGGKFTEEVKNQEQAMNELIGAYPELTSFYDGSRKDTAAYYQDLRDMISNPIDAQGRKRELSQTQIDLANGIIDTQEQVKRNAARELNANFAKMFPDLSVMIDQSLARELGAMDYTFLNKMLPSVFANFGYDAALNFTTSFFDSITSLDDGGYDAQIEYMEAMQNIDATNALTQLHGLNLEIDKAAGNDQLIATLNKTKEALNLGDENIDKTNLFKALSETESFNDLYVSLNKIYETNKDIEASDISDLVKDYKELGYIIEDAEVPASAVAQILESMVLGDIGLEELNDQLIEAVATATGLSNIMNEAFDFVDTFDPGRSEKEIADAYAGYAKNISDMFAEGAFGDTQLRNYWKALFGESGTEAFDNVMSQNYDTIEERNAAITNGLSQYLGIISQITTDGDLYALWDSILGGSPTEKLASALTVSNGIVDVNTSIIKTAEEMKTLLMESGYDENIANAMITDLRRKSAPLSYTWDNNAAIAGAQTLVQQQEDGTFGRKIMTTEDQENYLSTLPDNISDDTLQQINAVFAAYEAKKGIIADVAADWYNLDSAMETANNLLKQVGAKQLDVSAATTDNAISVQGLRDQLEVLNLTREQESAIINQVGKEAAKKGKQLMMTATSGTASKNFFASTVESLNQQVADWQATMSATNATPEAGVNVTAILEPDATAVNTWAATPLTKGVNLYVASFTGWELFARGKNNSYEGPALVSENGDELIQTKNGAYIPHGPTLTNLERDDVVYTASQTKKMLSNNIPVQFPRFDLGYGDGITIGAPSTGASGATAKDKKDFKNDLDKQYNLLQLIEEILRRQEKLQEAIEEASQVSATAVTDNLQEQVKLTQAILANAQTLLDHRKEEVAAFLKENEKFKDFGTYNLETGLISIDWDKINNEGNKETLEYIDKLEELQENVQDAEDKIDEANKTLQEIAEQGKETYFEIQDRLYDAIVERETAVIDKLSANNDAINDSNDRLISSLQSSLDKQRQERDNANTENDIAEKERRLALLQRDTSGSYALEIKQLQDEINSAKENYTDTLVDQAIQQLQDSYDLAAESREREIAMLENQQEWREENGYYWNEVLALLSGSAYGNATDQAAIDQIMALLSGSDAEYNAMSPEQQADYIADLTSQFSEAIGWYWNQAENKLVETRTESIKNDDGTITKNTIQKTTYYDPDGSVSGADEKIISTEVIRPVTIQPVDPNKPKSSNGSGKGSGYIYKGVAYGTKEQAGAAAVKDVLKNYGYPEPKAIAAAQKTITKKFVKGGLADYTGPAWLDGTKSRPELVLNAADTANFIQLKSILSDILGAGNFSVSGYGNSTIQVDISFDRLDPNTNIDEVVSKVEQAIIKKAAYRNVNVLTKAR